MMVEGSNPVSPMTNSDSGTAFPAPVTHPISDVDCNSLCSIEEFLAHMPETESVKCREFPRKKCDGRPPHFRVFWHPTGPNEPDPDFKNSAESSSIIVQYWTHTRSSSGQSMLTVLEQPFGISSMGTGFMDTRFCRYRYGCMKLAPVRVEDDAAGPLGRVFRRGSPEYSKMEYYSRKEFPLRDYVKFCRTYLALPIFEHYNCIGVLEFLSTSSYGNFQYVTNMKRLEGIGLTTLSRMHSHPEDCHKVRMYKDVLNFVRIERKLPLMLLWIPGFCHKTSHVTRLFCRWTGWGSDSSHNPNGKDERNLANGWHSVENGKGLVGRAYSQKKSCFSGDTSQFSISEYPVAHFTRSHGLTASFAIPFKSLNPRLQDIVLEVFLPPQENNSDHENIGIQLQSLLSAMAPNRQRSCAPGYNGSVLFELERDKKFCVQYSHSDGDNLVYFDVSQKHRYVGTSTALGNGRERLDFQPSQGTRDDHKYVMLNSDAESSMESFSNSHVDSLNGDQVQNRDILSSSREEKYQLLSPGQTPATLNNGDSSMQGMESLIKFAGAAEKFEVTNSGSGATFPAPENHPIFKGDGVCSVADFLAHINQLTRSESVECREFPGKKYGGSPLDFRVFWNPNGPNEPGQGFMDLSLYQCSGEKGLTVSVQTRIRCLLLEMNYYDASSLSIQYWTHSKSSSGQSILTVLEQPFRIGSMGAGFMDTRFCRYRYACMKQEIQVEDNLAGPVGRVLRRGSPEFSKQMEFYSREDFPLWDYAKFGGKYMALPIFEKEKCVGVLEFLSLSSWNIQCTPWTMKRLKGVGLTTLSHMHSHPGGCHKVSNMLISRLYKDVLHFTRIEHKLPLIQLWIPCICDKTSSVTRLFCRWTDWGSDTFCGRVKDETNLANGWHSVESGKGLVGRAFSQKKSCFSGDTSQFSISEYPLAHLTRSRGLTACFAVPLKSLDPKLHDIILEVFHTPPENSDHGNVGIQLQSLLSAIFQNSQSSHAPRYNGSVPFKLKPDKEFCVQYSHSEGDNFVYFDVSQKYRSGDTCKALGNGRKGHDFQPSQKTHDDKNYEMLSRDSESSRESFSNSHAESLDGDQVQSREILGSSRVKEQLSSPDQTPATVSNGDSNIQGRPRKRKELLNNQSASILQDTDFVEVGGKVTQEPEIGTFPNKRARENEALENGEISIMATYEDDTILFLLSCDSGIEELRKELEDAFQFGGQKFKVKYRHDNGIWITLLRDKDFRFHVESLKASGQSTVTLSVFSVSS